jgi:hypothetical protein
MQLDQLIPELVAALQGRHAQEREKRGAAWLRKIFAERGFITAEELLAADLGNEADCSSKGVRGGTL